MNFNLKNQFQHSLLQLQTIIEKIPADIFHLALTEGMFSLEMNAKIAANFALRGYCPLLNELNKEVISFSSDKMGKAEILRQITATLSFLNEQPEITELNENIKVSEKAGFSEIALTQPIFIHQYILPNFYFHISMVYAIARANGVMLSKGDYDGIHSYPSGFSFT